jgi:hypothetical protein
VNQNEAATEDGSSYEIRQKEVQDLISTLSLKGMTPQDIAAALEDRVSSRTIYRWAKGASIPQRRSDYAALVALVKEKEA